MGRGRRKRARAYARSRSGYLEAKTSPLRKAAWALVLLMLVAAGLAAFQLTRALPVQALSTTAPRHVSVPGTTALPFPHAGQAAVAVGPTGAAETSGAQSPVPIASLAKMMTAYVVLTDHPLTTATSGPSITVTAQDVATYTADLRAQESVLPVVAGEGLTEQEALEAILVASANNVADLLADWDAGGVPAFVAKMNATAVSLGMTHTTYTDPSGLAVTTVSTAADQLVLTRLAMANPVFAAIVAMPSATFPTGGTILNFNFDLGKGGVIGVKTGSDAASLGCWAFAASEAIAGSPQTVYGVVLGIPATNQGLIMPALAAGQSLIGAVTATVQSMTVLPAGTTVGYLTAPWRSPIPVVTGQPLAGFFSSGTTASVQVMVPAPTSTAVARGQRLGTVSTTGVSGPITAPLVAGAGGSGPSLSWRLKRL